MHGKWGDRENKDTHKASSRTGTFKGNKMVAEEGMEENKSKVKRMTGETFFPAGIVVYASHGKQPVSEHEWQHASPSWPWLS